MFTLESNLYIESLTCEIQNRICNSIENNKLKIEASSVHLHSLHSTSHQPDSDKDHKC